MGGVRIVCAALLVSWASSSVPHIISILQDDLGYWDTGINNNSVAAVYTGNITQLSREGIVLTNHYGER